MSEKNTVALNERDSSSLLSSCGVRMVASVLLDKPDRAAFEAASRQLGFPVAMKVLSDDILHKTDVGCVVLNVTDVDGMQAAYDTIMANAAKNAPGARVQGVLAEQMLPKGFEVLLGVSTDPQFGHVIMAGLGGVLVELLHAVSLRVLPITRQDAEDMIDETPLAKACQGLRGQQYRREEIVEALMCLSRLVEEHPEITEVDINPLMLYGDGRPATAVDAMVVIGGRNSSNTTRLAEVCALTCPRTFHVESTDELDPAAFAGCRRVGVTAGASTPENQIAAVEAFLRTL